MVMKKVNVTDKLIFRGTSIVGGTQTVANKFDLKEVPMSKDFTTKIKIKTLNDKSIPRFKRNWIGFYC